MTFTSFDDCLTSFKRIPDMEFEEFCTFFNDVLKAFPDKKKYLLDLFYDFGNPEVDNESNFIAVADSIVSVCNDINDLPLLLSYFDDAKDPEWAFDSLVTTIEKYYLAGLPYIETLLRNLGDLNRKAIAWAGRLVARIISSPDAYAIFKQNVSLANPDDLVRLLQYMRCHEDDFDYVEPQVNELLETLGA